MWLLPHLAREDGGGPRRLAHGLQGDLGSVFFGIVEVLAIIPVASINCPFLDDDGAGPSSAASCEPKIKTVSYPLSKARRLKVGVRLMRAGAFFILVFCKTPLLPAMPTGETLERGSGAQRPSVYVFACWKEQDRRKWKDPACRKKAWELKELTGERKEREWGKYLADRRQCGRQVHPAWLSYNGL